MLYPFVHHKIMDLKDFYHVYYTIKTFIKTYSKVVHLLLEADINPNKEEVIVLPPNFKINIGKLRKNI